MRQPKEHNSMWMFKDNHICHVGDIVRLRSEVMWMGPNGSRVFVPAGTLGKVKSYFSEWGHGIAFDFGIFSHPEFGVFPNALHIPGHSRYDDSFELISRKTVPHDDELHPPLPRRGLQEPPADWSTHVPRVLENDASTAEKSRDARSGESLRESGAQESGPGSRGFSP